MREIKFRAWYEEEKEMQSVIDIYFNKNKGDIESFVTKGKKATYHTDVHTHKLMQYTGLKDKNGVEIYDGDIVKDGNVLIGYVSFLIQEAGFVVVLKNSDYRLGHRNTAESYTVANGHEVIGNIYENPELLETKKSS